jgi:hypothetical protein
MAAAGNQNQNITRPPAADTHDFGLKFSYWYVTHKLQLKAMVVAVLTVLNMALFGYAGYRAFYLFYIDVPEQRLAEAQLTTQLIDYRFFQEQNRARPLQIVGSQAIPGQDGEYDFVARLFNPNEQLYAKRVVVEFVAGGQVVDQKVGFVLPGDQRLFMSFNNEAGFLGDAQIRVAEVEWQRVGFFEDFAEIRRRFTISEIEFTPSTELRLGDEFPISNLSFKVRNDSGFNYWNVGFAIILESGSGFGGANYIALSQFRSGETRDVSVRWVEPLPPIQEVEILPDVDILNPDSYMGIE